MKSSTVLTIPSDNKGLVRWAAKQRSYFKRDVLPKERVTLLEAIEGWSWDHDLAKWHANLNSLKELATSIGINNVNTATKDKNGFGIGQWLGNQKVKRDDLSAEQTKLLELIPGWSWIGYDAWTQPIRELRNYLEKNENIYPYVKANDPDERRLANWVSNVRARKIKMSAARENEVQSLPGWEWNKEEANWLGAFRELQNYVRQNGAALPVQGYKSPSGFNLGNWVAGQRTYAKNNPSHAAKLEALPGWEWNAQKKIGEQIRNRHRSAWEKGYSELLKYVEQYDDATPSGRYVAPSGYPLGSWVGGQKRSSKDYPEYYELLNVLPGWKWEQVSRKDEWENGFQRLSDWARENGHARPHGRLKLEDNFALGYWVETQRRRRLELSSYRFDRLETLPGWAWSENERRWNIGYEELKEFAELHGHCKPKAKYVAPSGYPLGGWVRKLHPKRNKLSKEQTLKLESLPGWLWR
jgi:hypothetical protein